jgi:hypothetical protein
MCFQSSTTTHIDGSPNPKTTTHVTRLPIIETTTHVDRLPITTSVTKTTTHIGRLPMTTSVTKTTIIAGVTKTTTSVTKTTPYIIGLLTLPTSESHISWIETNGLNYTSAPENEEHFKTGVIVAGTLASVFFVTLTLIGIGVAVICLRKLRRNRGYEICSPIFRGDSSINLAGFDVTESDL